MSSRQHSLSRLRHATRLKLHFGLAIACLFSILPATAWSHTSSIDVLVENGQLTTFQFPNGIPIAFPAILSRFELTDEILSPIPGFGVVNAANGLAPNSPIRMKVARPLTFWAGAPKYASETLSILPPDGSNRYPVTGDQADGPEFYWGTYDGELFWEEHGFFYLSTDQPSTGIYGLWLELSSPEYTTSEPFLVPFIYDPAIELNVAEIDEGIAALLSFEPILGDFDQSGVLDSADLDALAAAILSGTDDPRFDVNQDAQVDHDDRITWVEQLRGTYVGDANLDGEFDSGDLVLVLQAGEYEDELTGNSLWSTGDWNGDGEFDTGDLLVAFQRGGYEQGPRAARAASVPEPSTIGLLVLGLGWLTSRRRR